MPYMLKVQRDIARKDIKDRNEGRRGKTGRKEDRRPLGTVRLVSHVAITPASNFELSRFISQKSKSRKERAVFLKETPQYLQMFWFILWGGEKA